VRTSSCQFLDTNSRVVDEHIYSRPVTHYAHPLVYTTSLDRTTTIAGSCFDLLEDSTPAEKVRVPFWPLNPRLITISLYIYPLRACAANSRHTSRATSVLSSPRRLSPRNPLPASPPSTSVTTTPDGATANTGPIAFDTSAPCHSCLLPYAWIQYTQVSLRCESTLQ
jgi:hypothetical protein